MRPVATNSLSISFENLPALINLLFAFLKLSETKNTAFESGLVNSPSLISIFLTEVEPSTESKYS